MPLSSNLPRKPHRPYLEGVMSVSCALLNTRETTMNFSRAIIASGLVVASVSAFSVPAKAADVTGAGATFPFPVYSKWADAYKKETGHGVNYQSIGSGAGIKQIIAKTVTFGATDAPLKADKLEKHDLVQWPMVMGAIVPVVNIEGVNPGELVLSGELLGDIYLGKVTKWDDPALVRLNPGLKLPSTPIAVVHRSDGSGTSFNFTNYLSRVNAEWKSKVGEGTAVEWPAGVGAKGNEGVSGNVSQTRNSIGYVEYAYAKQSGLTHAALINKAGKAVEPTVSSFQAAAASADWSHAPGYHVILTDQPGEASWPIAAATFILMHKEPVDKAASAEAIRFFRWSFEKGGRMAEELDYIPMPESVVRQIEKTWTSEIKS